MLLKSALDLVYVSFYLIITILHRDLFLDYRIPCEKL